MNVSAELYGNDYIAYRVVWVESRQEKILAVNRITSMPTEPTPTPTTPTATSQSRQITLTLLNGGGGLN